MGIMNLWKREAAVEPEVDVIKYLSSRHWQQNHHHVEGAIGFISRCLSMAEIDDDRLNMVFNSERLECITRSLLECGNSLWRIQGENIQQASMHDITGSVDNWRYRLTIPAPSESIEVDNLTASDVLHFRIGTTAAAPWRGRGVMERTELVPLLQGLHSAMTNESRLPNFTAVVTSELSDVQRQAITQGLRSAGAAVVPWESNRLAASGRYGQQPLKDFEAVKLRAEVPQANVQMHGQLAADVNNLFGIPAALGSAMQSGSGIRDAMRHVNFSLLLPIAKAIETEISLKLMPVKISLNSLFASDINARARSYRSFIDAGMDPADAARIVGVDTDG